MVIRFPIAVRLAACTLIAALIAPDVYAGKRLKRFSTTEDHYIDELFYDGESGRLMMVQETGIPGDRYGESINQTALVDWSRFDSNLISIKTSGEGYIPDETVTLNADGLIARLEIPGDEPSDDVTYEYHYDTDGYCTEVIGSNIYNGHVYANTWTYGWENGDLVSYNDGYWTAEYGDTAYPDGAQFIGAFFDSFAMRFRQSFIGAYCGFMKSSRHHLTRCKDDDGYYDYYQYDLDEDGYPTEIRIYNDREMTRLYHTFTFEWEDSAAADDVNEDSEVMPESYFTPDGIRHTSPQHGLNIIRYTDGTTRKIFITRP
ncbi:MAG: hypothetical protein C7K11_00285 [Candidatus Amulumruptor caecigallinarius]|uniref:DUF4595 domain-containing protein n=1 Tax=Candidatus Amulumruptor caecigallinarius TaxID=2109911 RepID=A0A4Q0UB84_9BACT|nr:MAG: hypothetical protein C7K11_00285 [Candidatus Amulumruptor caecigallinarius]HJE38622.1 DUF4595 domain-containing protein [Candidatus Amulumruptor caecigallinarius]